ncbi:hypothetical protein [Fimbriimonas ginsengisoli]|uniref:Serine/threonine protein kinase n=1 Tax=Fimbriimonas ginsengisoli Gsoil 348 TaxID=661478 RepID=A0A068NPG7_FIMGI|nr:hypothetical protein [Fimbriimonas ginsengisoli]AIE84620.1 serine/threonine protein kinase [Fimbriimonas ginsengisoli Gsoil 348]
MDQVSAEEWLRGASEGELEEVEKTTHDTRAWFATIDGVRVFAKWYPSALRDTWSGVERSIAGQALHPSIVPLERVVKCAGGDLFLYPRVDGENLGQPEAKHRFSKLPTQERLTAVLAVCGALAAVCEAGFAVVDWYEGNMIYDFERRRIWLFDWELSLPGGSFVLEMDSNYGSSRLQAPEEFVRGSVIDQVTLVFNLGRFALLNLPELADELAPVLAKATYPAKSGRFQTVAELARALQLSVPKH